MEKGLIRLQERGSSQIRKKKTHEERSRKKTWKTEGKY